MPRCIWVWNGATQVAENIWQEGQGIKKVEVGELKDETWEWIHWTIVATKGIED